MIRQFTWPLLFAGIIGAAIHFLYGVSDPGDDFRHNLTPEIVDHSRIPDTLKIDSAILREQDSAAATEGGGL